MYQPRRPMTTKYYLISPKYRSDVRSSLTDQPDCLKIGTSLKCSTDFSCVPKGAVLRICRKEHVLCVLSFGLSPKAPHVASVVSDPREIDVQRCLTIPIWCWKAGVPSVPLATQSKAKSSSQFLILHSRDQAVTSHKLHPTWELTRLMLGSLIYIYDRASRTSHVSG